MKKCIQKSRTLIKSFNSDESGVAAIEYALIAAATSLALAATLPGLEAALSTTWSAIANYF